jgi:hypothetical protein
LEVEMRLPRSQRAVSRPLLVITSALGAALLSGSASGEGPADDGMAPGMVAFFGSETGVCPDGWAPAEYAMGRLVVGVVDEPAVGRQVGKPLADQEDRAHEHPFTTQVKLTEKNIAGADGPNTQGAKAQEYTVTGATEPSVSGLPFIQLLACEKL